VSDDNLFNPIQPGAFDDQLTEVLRRGARSLMAQAVEAEVADFLAKRVDLTGPAPASDGRGSDVAPGTSLPRSPDRLCASD